MIIIDPDLCRGCRFCLRGCAYKAITFINQKAEINPDLCKECEKCIPVCPFQAIKKS